MTMVGTPMFIAPEVQEGERYGPGADVYSFAITMYALVNPSGKVHMSFKKAYQKKRTSQTQENAGEPATMSCSPLMLLCLGMVGMGGG